MPSEATATATSVSRSPIQVKHKKLGGSKRIGFSSRCSRMHILEILSREITRLQPHHIRTVQLAPAYQTNFSMQGGEIDINGYRRVFDALARAFHPNIEGQYGIMTAVSNAAIATPPGANSATAAGGTSATITAAASPSCVHAADPQKPAPPSLTALVGTSAVTLHPFTPSRPQGPINLVAGLLRLQQLHLIVLLLQHHRHHSLRQHQRQRYHRRVRCRILVEGGRGL